MRKLLRYLFPFLLCLLVVIVLYDKLHVSKKEFQELVKNHPRQERLKLTKRDRKKMGIPPNKYFDQQYLLEMDPVTGKTYPENLEAIRTQNKGNQRFSAVPGQNEEMAWEERGPNNIGGRTRVVFYDPNDVSGKRVFAGGVSGGLWVNNDISNVNSMWVQVGIDENLSVSCYAIDPNNSNTWYVGTGEAYTGDDGVGNGIWITTNGGNTWSKFLGPDLSVSEIQRVYYVNQILTWNNNGTTELFFSLDGQYDVDPVGYQASGWWKVNGSSMNRISFNTTDDSPSPYVFSDVEVAADNSIWVATKDNLFGDGGGKVFRTTDGENFTEKYSFTNGGRVELAVSKQNANTIYALASTNNSTSVDLVKTTNGTFFESIARPNDTDTEISSNDFARNQGFYNLTLEVDPTNDAVLYAGGIDLFRSINSGTTWSQISKWSNNNNLKNLNVSQVHADHHAVTFNPTDNNKVVFANDGGIYYSSNASIAANSTTAIQSRNSGYNITQFYSGAISQDKNNEMLLGGAQDNGSLLGYTSTSPLSFNVNTGTNTFVDIYGGDGIETFIDKDGAYLIVSYVYNVYAAYPIPFADSDDLIEISDDQDSGSFVNIADLDDNLDILYADGTSGSNEKIHRYTNLLGTPQKQTFTNFNLFESPTAIKVSPYTTNASTVFIGTEGGTILKVTNFNTSNPTWENIDANGTINTGSVSSIDFGANENEVLVTLHNYGVNNIYYSSNGGETWLEKDGDFPDIPVKAIKVNPGDKNEVIIGTNAGVWRTANFLSESPSWVQSQNGMSSVKVTSFNMRTSDNTVLAATYGRGLFTGSFGESLGFTDNKSLENKVILNTNLIENQLLELELSDIDVVFDLFIVTINGDTIAQHKVNPTNGSFQSISVPFQAGVYLVKIYCDGKSFTRKIVIAN
ncbi:hypothetical protein FHR24_000542 [Wenyingzhuangia heitensis]|uniref:Por secretion system C-terminal sorting domain-containing protein n=1 Tax=Wenyingzhuangia heitensis TaxID=1487859 RepID=A0ABX0U7E5_9FLAO|nr:T9SS type A sorting domain-containing protein [Wenyingzhuangia heitensis]NIJ44103.1 hypothetical protein [Wenyingzhuangia heitensis]